MYIYLSLSYAKTHRYNEGLYKTYPQGIYRCHVLDRIRSLRSFYASKNKASSKRLSTIYVSPFQPPFLQGLRHGDRAKIKKKRKSGLKRMKKIPFQRQKSTSAERKINLSQTIFQSPAIDFLFGAERFHVVRQMIFASQKSTKSYLKQKTCNTAENKIIPYRLPLQRTKRTGKTI